MEIGTIFESERFGSEDVVIPFKEIKPLLKGFISRTCSEKDIEFNGEDEIFFNSTKITFYLNYSSKSKRYFLCIGPKNIWTQPSKGVLLPAINETIEFFKLLPNDFKLDDVKFVKSQISSYIQTDSWTFATSPDIGKNKISEITTIPGVKAIGQAIYNKNVGLIDKNLIIINAGGIVNSLKLKSIKDKIAPLFTTNAEIITNNDIIIETISQRTDKNRLFVLFFGDSTSIQKYYKVYKNYFISNAIPSQFISSE